MPKMAEDFAVCSEQILGEKWKSWCRLCAKADAEYIYIVEGQSQDVHMTTDGCFKCEKYLANIILKHLRIHIKEDDKLPQIICKSCHEFVLALSKFSECANKVQEMYNELQNSIDKSTAQLQRLLENYGINAYKDEVMIPQSDMELLAEDIFVAVLKDITTITNQAKRDSNNDEMSTNEQQAEEIKQSVDNPMDYHDPIAAVKTNVESESDSPAPHVGLSSERKSCTEDESLLKPQVAKKSKKIVKIKIADEKRCKICVKKFHRRSNLTVHMKNKHNLLLCRCCTSTFKTESELKQHIKAQHRKLWNCLHCEEKFAKKSLLSNHIKRSHNAKPRRKGVNKQIPVEEKVVGSKSCVAAPEDGFSSANEGSCEDESLSKAKVANTNTTTEFCCSICSKEFLRHCNLTVHMKKYHNLFLCRHCMSTFKMEAELKQHLITQHRKLWNCQHCEQTFERKGLLSKHIKMEHDIEVKSDRSTNEQFDKRTTMSSSVCEVCGVDLLTKKKLRKHYHTHTDYSFECKHCGQVLKTLYCYRRHIQIHGDKFICQKCGQALSTKAAYLRHLLVHSDVLKYKCDLCGRAFKRGRALKYHLIAHAGLRPYSCDFCGKTFTTGSSCRLHKKTLHPNELAEFEASGMKTFANNIPKLAALKELVLASKQNGQT